MRSTIWRTTPVRISIYFTVAWIIGLALLNTVVLLSAKSYLTAQGEDVIRAQIQGLETLSIPEISDQMKFSVRTDVRQVRLYGLFTEDGQPIAGNVEHFPQGLSLDGKPKWLSDDRFVFGARAMAVKLSGGQILMVGYDAKSLTNLSQILLQTLLWSCLITVLVGAGIGTFLGLGPMRRLKEVHAISRKIAEGSLNLRLPVSTRGDELDTLSALVNGMIGEVESMLESVKSVGDNVAHDLRTPLNQLRGHLHRTVEQWETDDPKHQQARIVAALEATNTLLERFRALERISEIDNRSRRAGMAVVDLTQLFEETAESYAAVAQDAGIGFDFKMETGSPVMADKHVIAEVLSNLLENALKFTPAGGEIGLSLSRPDGRIVIQVRDNGPGIPEEDREKVLYRFGRSLRDQAVPGAGLGLAIVNAGARLHDFDLTFADGNPGLVVTLSSKSSPMP